MAVTAARPVLRSCARHLVTDRWLDSGNGGLVSGMNVLICDDHALSRTGTGKGD